MPPGPPTDNLKASPHDEEAADADETCRALIIQAVTSPEAGSTITPLDPRSEDT